MEIFGDITRLESTDGEVSVQSPLPVHPYLTDEFGVKYKLLGDNIFEGSPVVIDNDHHEIHCGDSFMMTRTVDLAGGASDILIINIPDEIGTPPFKQYHFVFSIITESETHLECFEGTTTVSDGTSIQFYNRNRNSSLTTGVTAYHTPNTPAAGTLIYSKHWGAGRGMGGEGRGSAEIILKDATKYRIILTNSTATNNYISWEVDHYIHPGI